MIGRIARRVPSSARGLVTVWRRLESSHIPDEGVTELVRELARDRAEQMQLLHERLDQQEKSQSRANNIALALAIFAFVGLVCSRIDAAKTSERDRETSKTNQESIQAANATVMIAKSVVERLNSRLSSVEQAQVLRLKHAIPRWSASVKEAEDHDRRSQYLFVAHEFQASLEEAYLAVQLWESFRDELDDLLLGFSSIMWTDEDVVKELNGQPQLRRLLHDPKLVLYKEAEALFTFGSSILECEALIKAKSPKSRSSTLHVFGDKIPVKFSSRYFRQVRALADASGSTDESDQLKLHSDQQSANAGYFFNKNHSLKFYEYQRLISTLKDLRSKVTTDVALHEDIRAFLESKATNDYAMALVGDGNVELALQCMRHARDVLSTMPFWKDPELLRPSGNLGDVVPVGFVGKQTGATEDRDRVTTTRVLELHRHAIMTTISSVLFCVFSRDHHGLDQDLTAMARLLQPEPGVSAGWASSAYLSTDKTYGRRILGRVAAVVAMALSLSNHSAEGDDRFKNLVGRFTRIARTASTPTQVHGQKSQENDYDVIVRHLCDEARASKVPVFSKLPRGKAFGECLHHFLGRLGESNVDITLPVLKRLEDLASNLELSCSSDSPSASL